MGADDDGHIFVFKHNLKYMYMCVCVESILIIHMNQCRVSVGLGF